MIETRPKKNHERALLIGLEKEGVSKWDLRDSMEELAELAQKQQRILMVGHTFEYSPAVNELRKLWIMQLHRRDVHGDPERIRPSAGFRACLSQHPFADLLDRSTFLCDGNEQGGWNLTALRVAPPQQGLEAGDLARIKPGLRLIGQYKFIPCDRAAKIVLQHAAIAHLNAHCGFKEAIDTAAVGFCAIERSICVREKAPSVLGVVRENRDANAGGNEGGRGR